MKEDVFHLGIKGLIRNKSGELLLMQIDPEHIKRHGYNVYDGPNWDLPGGRVEKGATATETLKREIAEETGITEVSNIKPVGMILSNIRIPAGDQDYGLILSIYTCSIPEDAIITLSKEHCAAEWVVPAEAAKRLAVKFPPEFCDMIAKL